MILNIQSISDVFKILLLILAFLHFIFTFIVNRQVSLMTESLITEVAPIIVTLSYVYMVLGFLILVLFIKLI